MTCKHEWFEGRCVHCEMTPTEAKTNGSFAAPTLLADFLDALTTVDAQCWRLQKSVDVLRMNNLIDAHNALQAEIDAIRKSAND